MSFIYSCCRTKTDVGLLKVKIHKACINDFRTDHEDEKRWNDFRRDHEDEKRWHTGKTENQICSWWKSTLEQNCSLFYAIFMVGYVYAVDVEFMGSFPETIFNC